MALVRRKIFICDHCGEVKLPQIDGEWPFEYIEKPYGWGEFGGYHLCPKCYEAWERLKIQSKSEGDNGNSAVVDDEEGCGLIEDVMWEVNAQATADVAPVVHGMWIDNKLTGYKWAFNCSNCGFVDGYPFNDRFAYCPNCGAKMDGGANNEP